MDTNEEVIWEGRPSHWAHGSTYALGVIFFWLVIPVIVAGRKAIGIMSTEYTVTDERILVKKGILSKSEHQLELYRVKDIQVEQPFMLGLHDLAHIELRTSDPTHPTFRLKAVPRDENLRDRIRNRVEQRRDEKDVREVDYH